jgi:tryptophanyl-tRNA synthetase
LMEDPQAIDVILQQGALKARAIATPKLKALREALGLRTTGSATTTISPKKAKPKVGKLPRFASFRDAEGRFRFRLFSIDGEELLLSMPFEDPKAAGALQKQIGSLGGSAAVMQLAGPGMHLEIGGKAVASTPDYADQQALDDALVKLREALDQLAVQD